MSDAGFYDIVRFCALRQHWQYFEEPSKINGQQYIVLYWAAQTCTEDGALQGAQFGLQALERLALALQGCARQLLSQLLPQLPQHLLRLQGGCLLVCHDLRPQQPGVAHDVLPGLIDNGNSAFIFSAKVQHLDTYASAALP